MLAFKDRKNIQYFSCGILFNAAWPGEHVFTLSLEKIRTYSQRYRILADAVRRSAGLAGGVQAVIHVVQAYTNERNVVHKALGALKLFASDGPIFCFIFITHMVYLELC
jgi:hypothetical protein